VKPFQKTKYFVFGSVVAVMAIPLVIKAADTIPLSFNKGDIISASVFNALLANVNNVVSGFKTGADIAGTWACTTYSARTGCITGFVGTGGGVLSYKTQNITFSCNSGACTATASSFYPGSCQGGGSLSQPYELNGNIMASGWGIYGVQKLSPTKFVWQINSSLPQMEYVICNQNNAVPSAVNNLTATVNSGSVVLVWTDTNADQTGYIVQRSSDGGNTWTTISTISSAGTMTYTDTGLSSGSYQYQVIATNSNGNSIGSSVVPATI